MLHHNELDKMKREFASIAKEFYKRQMQQTKLILSFHLHMLKTFGKTDLTKSGRFVNHDHSGNFHIEESKSPQVSTDLNSTLQFSQASSEESYESEQKEAGPLDLANETSKQNEEISQQLGSTGIMKSHSSFKHTVIK